MQQEMKNKVSIIGAPFSGGQPKGGVERGPAAIRAAGVVSSLRDSCGVEIVYDNDVMIGTSAGAQTTNNTTNAKNADKVSSLCHNLHQEVRSHASSSRCLILGGDHSIAVGSISGILAARKDTMVVWVDAHADINTPSSSPSGNMHGMPVAMLMRLTEHIEGFDWLQNTTPLPTANIVYIGLRDLDEGEVELIKKHNIHAFNMSRVRELGISEVMRQVVALAENKTIHLSFDVDGIDPAFTPATGTPVHDGLSLDEGVYICKTLAETNRLLSVDLVEVNPSLGNKEEAQLTCEASVLLAQTCFKTL